MHRWDKLNKEGRGKAKGATLRALPRKGGNCTPLPFPLQGACAQHRHLLTQSISRDSLSIPKLLNTEKAIPSSFHYISATGRLANTLCPVQTRVLAPPPTPADRG